MRVALAGCTTAEIATITGHKLQQVAAILDAHYLSRDPALGRSAIRKREEYEAGTDSSNRATNCSGLLEPETWKTL